MYTVFLYRKASASCWQTNLYSRSTLPGEVWHDLFPKQLHRAHNLFVGDAAKGKIAAEVVNALCLERPDFGDTLLRCADEGAVLINIIVAQGKLGARPTPVLNSVIPILNDYAIK
jgi:hypothetical protein